MESLKMYYLGRCTYRTYQCGAAKYPISCGVVWSPEWEICGNLGLPIVIVPHLHQSNGDMKRKLRAWRVQKCITLVDGEFKNVLP